MTTLTIEFPDDEAVEILKYLKTKHVVIKSGDDKSLDTLTVQDYRGDTAIRAKKTRNIASRYL